VREGRLCLGIPMGRFFPAGREREVIDLARSAEAAGVDTLIAVDHVVMGERLDRYLWGPFPFTDLTTPWPEPLTTLAAIAGATSRIRLATGIVIAALRAPALFAKTVATLDVLSRGRVDLGVGTGWQKEEYDACQLDFARRGVLLTETIAACRALWTQSPASYRGETMSFEKIWCHPQPVQPGGIPVWFSGTLNKANMDRLTELGDGWIPIMGESLEGMREGRRRIEDAWAKRGRDPAKLRVRGSLRVIKRRDGSPDLRASLEDMHAQREAGATEATLLMMYYVDRPEQCPAFFAELKDAWAAVKRAL
jgi:probable F420-dependent oxidoreductase